VPAQGGLPIADAPSLSADGRTLAFQSRNASTLSQVYVVDLDTDTITLASEGFAVDETAQYPQISADGRFVAFQTRVLDADRRGTGYRVHRRDLDTSTTVLVSATAGGVAADGLYPAITADGNLVAFQSDATHYLIDDANGDETDIFVKDLTSGAVSLVTRDAQGAQGAYNAYGASLSADGRWVVFGGYSESLVPIGPGFCLELWCGSGFVPGYSFVVDRDTGWVALLTVAADGTSPNDYDQTDVVLSADGRYAIFRSYSTNMVDGQTNEEFQLYWVENPLWQP
jgi:Tol biopolymer transport system component